MRSGSTTTADAAASASARNVSGSARTSLRRALLVSAVNEADAPAARNRVRASVEVNPVRSVRCRAVATRRRGRVGGTRGCRRRSTTPGRAGEASETSSSRASCRAVTRPLVCRMRRVATRRSARICGHDAAKSGHKLTTLIRHTRPMSHTPSAGTPIIEAAGLTKRYGEDVHALAGLDLVAESGKVTAILGPNGAGKTTFVKAVATLLRAPTRARCASPVSTPSPSPSSSGGSSDWRARPPRSNRR